jgi:hypothetical protein
MAAETERRVCNVRNVFDRVKRHDDIIIWLAEASQIYLRDAHVLLKLLRYKDELDGPPDSALRRSIAEVKQRQSLDE